MRIFIVRTLNGVTNDEVMIFRFLFGFGRMGDVLVRCEYVWKMRTKRFLGEFYCCW